MDDEFKERRAQRRKRAEQNLEKTTTNDTFETNDDEDKSKNQDAPVEKLLRPRRDIVSILRNPKTNIDYKNEPSDVNNLENNTEMNLNVNYKNERIESGQAPIHTAIINKHRDKSIELSERIVEDDPNAVVDELNSVRNKIKDKTRNSRADIIKGDETKKDFDPSEKKKEPTDLKLDLTMSTNDPQPGISRQSGTDNGTGGENSFRELSLQRIKRIKQQAEDKSNYRLAGSARREATRFDDDKSNKPEKEEEKKKEEIVADQTSTKKKFKKIGEVVMQDLHVPDRHEQYDFFTNDKFIRDDISDDDEDKKTKSTTNKDGIKEKLIDTTNEKTALLIGDTDVSETIYVKAEYLSHEVQKKEEKKLHFCQVPNQRKLGDEVEKPRFLETEGYYVGQKPYITIKNKNLMTNRLIKLPENMGKKWFGVDGEIIALSDPIKYVATRPTFNDTYSEAIDTEYRKALYVENFANNLISEKGIYNKISASKYRIDLDINQAQFNFHHLFSAEHVLSFRLENMFKHFKKTQEQNLVEILTAKLKALKEAEVRFKNELSLQSSRGGHGHNIYLESSSTIIKTKMDESQANSSKTNISPSDSKKLNAYKNEIKQTRQLRDNEMRANKDLIEKILTTWKELKDIRNKQQFRNTDLKLIIKKKDVDKDKEQKIFNKELKEEFEETLAEKTDEFNYEMSTYNQKLKAYKFQQTKKAEAKKRLEKIKKDEKSANLGIMGAANLKEMEEKDLKIINEEDLPQPIKPIELNKDSLFESLKEHYNRVRKPIGEPILFFELIEEPGSVSPTSQCSSAEQTRRNKLARTKVYVKIYFNDKLVFTTTESQLQNDFTVKWGQIFNIFMITFPDSILLQMFEYYDSKSHERLIAEINLPMPELNCTSANYILEDYEFASPHAFYMHLKTTNQIELFFTSGILKASAAWGIDEKEGIVLVPPILKVNSETAIKQEELKNYDAIAALGVSKIQDIERLAKWIIKSNLDPNDPRNSDLINLIKNITESDGFNSSFDGLIKLPDHFRLDQMMHEFNFQTSQDIDSNRRFRLILLRSQDEPEFRGFKKIPINERYIRRDVFDQYEKRKLRDVTENEDENEDIKSPKAKDVRNEIEDARIAGQKYMRRIRDRILKQFKFIQSQKNLSDMVIEEQVPNINALGALFYNLYVEPKRPLYPSRRERKKITGQNLESKDVKILINIVNAYDLPIRKEKITNDPIRIVKDPKTGKAVKVHEHIAGESLVRPFVEVTFQEAVYRTATADGPNASWNQEVQLPFKAPNNDLRPESLQTCRDFVFFNLYDEVEVDVLEDERDRNNVIHKKLLRYWLGTLKIPFSSIYFKSKIEGTFKLETPSIMLGYTRDLRLSRIQNTLADTAINLENPRIESSYLTLFITIEPQLLVPDTFRESYDSIENIDLLDKAVKWSQAFTKKFPNREFRPTVMNTDGKSVIMTRYFRPIKPPPDLILNGENSNDTTMRVARFVSLIPYVSDSLVFPGLCDVWSTCEEFLEILAGDEEEHSVLLVNYFLGLGKKAWLLIGTSITDGVCAYALTLEDADYIIWYQGKPYKVNEPHNPIRVVSAIVNDKNMWINVQSFEEPYRIKFDVNDGKCWQPFFNKSNNLELASIQKENLRYFKTDLKIVKEMESKIEARLVEKLKEWRRRFITRFNRLGCSTLRKILANMEKSQYEPLQNQTEPEDLIQLESTYRVSGFPINLPYTNMEAIYEAVKATQVHEMPTDSVEYALAVSIFAYPNTIMSVWIYLAVLNNKQ